MPRGRSIDSLILQLAAPTLGVVYRRSLLDSWNRRCTIVHASTPGTTRPKRADGFVFSCAKELWLPDTVLRAGPIPVADPCRLLATMAIDHTKWQLAFVLDRLVYQKRVEIPEVAEYVEAHRGAPGNATLRAAVQLALSGSVGSRGPMEDKFLEFFQRVGIEESIVYTLGSMGVPRDEPDFVWPNLQRSSEFVG